MGRLKGKDIVIYTAISGEAAQPIALSTDCELQVSCDVLEISSYLSGRSKSFIPGRYAWNVSSSSLVSDDDKFPMLGLLKNGTTFYITFTLLLPTGNKIPLMGKAFVTQFELGAPLSGMATAAVSFQGTDDLEIIEE